MNLYGRGNDPRRRHDDHHDEAAGERAEHGDHAAHFFFPEERWEELTAQGRIAPHPVFPDRHGPAARRIEGDADVEDVIALMRINYEEAVARAERHARRG